MSEFADTQGAPSFEPNETPLLQQSRRFELDDGERAALKNHIDDLAAVMYMNNQPAKALEKIVLPARMEPLTCRIPSDAAPNGFIIGASEGALLHSVNDETTSITIDLPLGESGASVRFYRDANFWQIFNDYNNKLGLLTDTEMRGLLWALFDDTPATASALNRAATDAESPIDNILDIGRSVGAIKELSHGYTAKHATIIPASEAPHGQILVDTEITLLTSMSDTNGVDQMCFMVRDLTELPGFPVQRTYIADITKNRKDNACIVSLCTTLRVRDGCVEAKYDQAFLEQLCRHEDKEEIIRRIHAMIDVAISDSASLGATQKP